MNELILIAKSLEQIANELAEIKYILKYNNNKPGNEDRHTETTHDPTPTLYGTPKIVVHDEAKTYTQEEFRRLAQ